MGVFRILVATDGSERSEHAVRVARSMVDGRTGQLEVVAVETEGIPELSGGPVIRRNTPTSASVWVRGIPGVEIVRRAEQWQADLVVLGRCPRSPADPFRLGPTSDAVIRRRHGASMFIPPSVCSVRRVLIALDGTHRGIGVLETAAAVAALTRAEPTVLMVIPDGAPSSAGDTDPRVVRVREPLDRFPALGGGPRLQVRHGHPVGEILRVLADTKADLLVLGVRGGGPIGEMGSGHVGRDLLQSAPGAILSIPI